MAFLTTVLIVVSIIYFFQDFIMFLIKFYIHSFVMNDPVLGAHPIIVHQQHDQIVLV